MPDLKGPLTRDQIPQAAQLVDLVLILPDFEIKPRRFISRLLSDFHRKYVRTPNYSYLRDGVLFITSSDYEALRDFFHPPQTEPSN